MNNKEKPFVSFIVYAHNYESGIASFALKLAQKIKTKFESYEIIVVNDGSEDGTLNEINKVSKKIDKDVVIIDLSWYHGVDLGIMAGADFAIGDYIVEIDTTDADYSLDIIYDLYKEATNGHDVVVGSPRYKIPLTSEMFYKIFKRSSNLSFDLSTEKIRIVTRRALNAISQIKDKIYYRKILYRYSGFPHSKITYDPIGGKKTAKKHGQRMILALEMLLTFSNIGFNLSVLLSFLFFIVSILIGVYTLFIYFDNMTKVEGWTTLMLFLSFGFSGLFLMVGLLIKYLEMVLNEVKKRPEYTVKSVTRN